MRFLCSLKRNSSRIDLLAYTLILLIVLVGAAPLTMRAGVKVTNCLSDPRTD